MKIYLAGPDVFLPDAIELGPERPRVDLEKQIADGTFREDLYFRLNGATLALPALQLLPWPAAWVASPSGRCSMIVLGVPTLPNST